MKLASPRPTTFTQIVPNDFIYSPIWSPGTRLGVALVGQMDIDEDGRDDREYIRNLIRMNGGQVDAEVSGTPPNDTIQGEMTVDTRYIIVGSGQLSSKSNTLLERAKVLTIERMSLNELLDLMSPPDQARTIMRGGALGPGDYAPKPRDGFTRRGVESNFRKRTALPRRDRPKEY